MRDSSPTFPLRRHCRLGHFRQQKHIHRTRRSCRSSSRGATTTTAATAANSTTTTAIATTAIADAGVGIHWARKATITNHVGWSGRANGPCASGGCSGQPGSQDDCMPLGLGQCECRGRNLVYPEMCVHVCVCASHARKERARTRKRKREKREMRRGAAGFKSVPRKDIKIVAPSPPPPPPLPPVPSVTSPAHTSCFTKD
jgi:hypothetical protein